MNSDLRGFCFMCLRARASVHSCIDQVTGSLIHSTQIFFFLSFVFLGLHLQHVEVPRLGVELELQLPAYTTVTAMLDLSCVCNLHHHLDHNSWQCWILNPLSEPRIEPISSWILVGFVTAEPQWELPSHLFNNFVIINDFIIISKHQYYIFTIYREVTDFSVTPLDP